MLVTCLTKTLQLPDLKMYARSGKSIPFLYAGDDNTPYSNDRLDDAVSVDYSQDISGIQTNREMSEAAASEINRDDTSGVYAHRFGSSRQQTTSTPEFTLRKTFLENNGDYTTEIRNSKRDNSSELDQNYDSNNRKKGIMMDRLGRTHAHPVYENRAFNDRGDNVYPAPAMKDDDGLKGLETPRSIQWPETARSYPLGFEASHVMNNGAISQSRGQRAGDRQKTIETLRQNSQNKRNSLNSETPAWVNLLLTKDPSLLGKFQNVSVKCLLFLYVYITKSNNHPSLSPPVGYYNEFLSLRIKYER